MRSHCEVCASAKWSKKLGKTETSRTSTIAIFVTQRKRPNAFTLLAIYGQLNVVYAVDGDEEVAA